MGDSRLSRILLQVFTVLVVVFLFAPIVVMIVFSFNDPAGRQNITWQGFTFENYIDIWSRPQITGPMVTSIAIAAISTILATTFGTMIALALSRYEFRGRGALNLLIFIPMAAPEIILGASLLTMWISIGVPRGFLTILIAHVMFNISYVIVTLRPRLVGFNRQLEEAGMDLYANERQTFWRVTFPIIFPGHPRGRAAGVRSVDRRLRHHPVQRRAHGHVPAVGVRGEPGRDPAGGQRAGHADLPRRDRLHRRPALEPAAGG